MLDRLASSRERQRAFVADAAHELRSPLASMHTQLEVAQRLGEGGDLPADLLADVQRLSRMVEDLLLLARAGADAQRARHDGSPSTPCRCSPTWPAGMPPHRSRSASPTAPAVFVSADREELRRVLSNLVDNGVRHAGTEVVWPPRSAAVQALLTVTDDGPGIPPADRERVFDRFTRLDDARSRDAGGSGLGLAIVRELSAAFGRHHHAERTDSPAGGAAGRGAAPPLSPPGEPAGSRHANPAAPAAPTGSASPPAAPAPPRLPAARGRPRRRGTALDQHRASALVGPRGQLLGDQLGDLRRC